MFYLYLYPPIGRNNNRQGASLYQRRTKVYATLHPCLPFKLVLQIYNK